MKAPRPQPQTESHTWYVVLTCNTCFFQTPGLFPGDISVQEGVRKWPTGHSCLSRFLPSVFVFLFPYSDSIWMELNLDSAGCFWRLFLSISGVPVHKPAPESLNLDQPLRPGLFSSISHIVNWTWVIQSNENNQLWKRIFTLRLLQVCFWRRCEMRTTRERKGRFAVVFVLHRFLFLLLQFMY